MALNEMAILVEVDKCIRCNGCVISCKRTWNMKALNPGVHKIAPDQRVIIKSQNRVDMGPFVRFSCWHCPDPPCVKRCPFKALKKQPSGAVSIDQTLCNPDSALCEKQCQLDCGRGGYPRIGDGSNTYSPLSKSQKCTICHTRAGKYLDVDGVTELEGDLPTRIVPSGGNYYSLLYPTVSVPELAHEPSCVYTCPAKALRYDTRDNIIAYLSKASEGWMSYQGDGSMWWASKKYLLLQPCADPYVEDHVSPMVGSLLSGPIAKAALLPALLAGGIFLMSNRRTKLADEAAREVR